MSVFTSMVYGISIPSIFLKRWGRGNYSVPLPMPKIASNNRIPEPRFFFRRR
jgi:hypothetical protein